MKKKKRLKNPTLLTLLKMGCKVEFPSGYYLEGDTSMGYIQLGMPFGTDGVRHLTREGVHVALTEDLKNYDEDHQ